MIAFVIFLTFTIASVFTEHLVENDDRIVNVWMCLERCFNNTPYEIEENVRALANHQDSFSMITFESFAVGPSGNIVPAANLTNVASSLRKAGISAPLFGMISTFPQPATTMTRLRAAFEQPERFVDEAVRLVREHDLSGINLDLEPSGLAPPGPLRPTSADALAYARVVALLNERMLDLGKIVTVAYSTWSPLWNTTALVQSGAPLLFSMGTYAPSLAGFDRALKLARSTVPLAQRALALATYNISTFHTPLSASAMKERFSLLQGERTLGIWTTPISKELFALMKDFLQKR